MRSSLLQNIYEKIHKKRYIVCHSKVVGEDFSPGHLKHLSLSITQKEIAIDAVKCVNFSGNFDPFKSHEDVAIVAKSAAFTFKEAFSILSHANNFDDSR